MKAIKKAAIMYSGRNIETDLDEVFPYPMRSILLNKERAFYAGVKFAQQWISVKDKLPEDSQEVLLKFKNLDYHIVLFFNKYKNTFSQEALGIEFKIDSFSNWRPIN